VEENEQLNETIDCLLMDALKAKEKLMDAHSISDVMVATKFLMECIIEDLPLESWQNPFCWLLAEEKVEEKVEEKAEEDGDAPWESYRFPRKKEDCKLCEYAKVYGNCFQKGSALDKVDKAKWRLLYAIRRYWKEEEPRTPFW